jgi:amino acid transporter
MPSDDQSLQEQVEQRQALERGGFGTFAGVFTPTLLTILGVIMYLRLGSVVGNAGLVGAWGIIALAFGITTMTALSMSSITTNIRIGAGGAYSIISQSLGLEVGGAIGIPLYLSQALAIAMYVFGFRAGWLSIFPNHPALLVDLATFGVLFAVAAVSADLAFRVQYVIMAIIGASLIAVFGTVFTGALRFEPALFGSYAGFPETDFAGTTLWTVFAIFFPAATGIMAGANMSGDLANPRRGIPAGTLSAIAVSFVVYMALAWWLAAVASPAELVENYMVMIDKALWSPIVLAGLLGATFSSGLSSLVGEPRILQALGSHRILPGSRIFATLTDSGEPRNALFVSSAIVLAALMLRDLNAIAALLSMFFLITYAMINVVVLFEQSLGLVSFRPLLRIPLLVPLAGVAGSLFAMFVIHPIFSLVAMVVVVGFYGFLVRRHLAAPYGDLRSGHRPGGRGAADRPRALCRPPQGQARAPAVAQRLDPRARPRLEPGDEAGQPRLSPAGRLQDLPQLAGHHDGDHGRARVRRRSQGPRLPRQPDRPRAFPGRADPGRARPLPRGARSSARSRSQRLRAPSRARPGLRAPHGRAHRRRLPLRARRGTRKRARLRARQEGMGASAAPPREGQPDSAPLRIRRLRGAGRTGRGGRGG